MLKLGILCSGGLGIDTLKKINSDYVVEFVLTDKKSIEIIEFSKKEKIAIFIGNPRLGKGYSFVKNFNVDVIISINYLFLIEEDIINHSKKITFNIHGSLLPKYRGRTPHVWAIINDEKEAGITAHIIDKGCDTGDIIEQIAVPIKPNDTGADMLIKYSKLYYPLIKKVLFSVENDSLELKKQNNSEASYYGKRTPLDGEIDWNKSVLEIINWVRAQANPYPGAFTFYENEKIIIDKVSKYTGAETLKNYSIGEIVKTKPNIVVKCKNGFVTIDILRSENRTFVKGNKFNNENRT